MMNNAKPRRKYTQDQIDRALDLRESGLTFARIEALTGMCAKSAQRYCLLKNAQPPNPPAAGKRPVSYLRNGVLVRHYTGAEDRQLLEWDRTGVSRRAMARRLGRNPNSVTNRLAALERRAIILEEQQGGAA